MRKEDSKVWVFAAILGIIGLIGLALFTSQKKKCKYCGGENESSSTNCKFCGHQI